MQAADQGVNAVRRLRRQRGMMRRALSLALLFALSACTDFEARYAYLGERRLSEDPMEVKTAFWPEDEAMVFATYQRDGEPRPSMYLVPLSGERPACRTGTVTRFAAVADIRGFRLALFDGDAAQLAFYTADCERLEPFLEEVESMGLRTSGGLHRFLVRTLDDRLLSADPYAGVAVELARDVDRVGSGLLHLRAGDAVWVQNDDGLAPVDLKGNRLAEPIPDVDRFVHFQGSGLSEDRRVLVAVQRDGEVALLDETGVLYEDALRDDDDLIWTQDDACAPRMETVYDRPLLASSGSQGALAEPAMSADEASRGLLGVWVSMYSPCDDDRLVLRSDTDEDTDALVVAEGVTDYRLLGFSDAGRPLVVFRTEDDEGKRDFVTIAGETPVDLGVLAEMDSVAAIGGPERGEVPDLRFVTDEDGDRRGRWGTWSREDGFEHRLEGIDSISGSGLVLHDYDGGLGTLSLCVRERCQRLASGVPSGAYHSYETLERTTDGRFVFTFLHDYDREAGVGRVTVLDRFDGTAVEVTDDARSFVPIELGPARGVVYSVPDGPRRGLWFAPR